MINILLFSPGKANDILTEWQHTGPMKTNKAKKKKKVQKKKESESTISKIQDQSSNESNLVRRHILMLFRKNYLNISHTVLHKFKYCF